MATFSKEFEGKYGVNTYQDTKNTYEWILKALDKGNYSKLDVEAEFLFEISGIMCNCSGIEEFIENAYEQGNYTLYKLYISAYSDKMNLAYISVGYDNNVRISTESKVLLEKIINILQETSLTEVEINDPASLTYIGQQNNNIVVNGTGNIVATHQSTVTSPVKDSEKESRVKQWFRAIMQNLLSNGLWYLLCFGIGAVITLFLSKR